ncbi:4Fe-4S binding protein [Pseudobutyrivibrio ruminis]|uniref:4Fe-4S binding protein n=1 Tax=Pseudobutyrivibrio ruminis TaxID=46206 RepID=UPI00051B4EC0|nr:4Fe-4S binding protein [Pseudobutyrivibrio ruminis]
MAKKKASVNVASCVACGVCRLQCPRQAISIYKGCYAIVDENLCVGCGLCAKACPASVIEVKERDVING